MFRALWDHFFPSLSSPLLSLPVLRSLTKSLLGFEKRSLVTVRFIRRPLTSSESLSKLQLRAPILEVPPPSPRDSHSVLGLAVRHA